MISIAGDIIRKGFKSFNRWRNYANSRKQARNFRKKVIAYNGESCVTSEMITSMKSEMKQRFGDEGHWPWIALYSELRGEYMKGWVPNDFYAFEIIPAVNPVHISYLSTYKSLDHRLFHDFSIEPILLWINNSFYTPSGQFLKKSEGLTRLQNYENEIVIKMDNAASGQGILFKDSNTVSMKDFPLDKTGVVQPSVTQHPELAYLYNESVNTIRVYTFLRRDGHVDIKYRLLRIGAGGRRIVNEKENELCVYLDETGTIVSDAVNYIGINRGNRHPDTGISYRGIKIPSIPEADKICREAHSRIPYIKLIGWDLFIEPDGTPKIIEWNARQPDMWVNEAHIGPLWTNNFLDEIVKNR